MSYLVTSNLILFSSTVLGMMPVLFMRRIEGTTKALVEGLCAGAMLGAAWIALLNPSLEMVEGAPSAQLTLVAMVVLGYFSLELIHKLLPHEHDLKGTEGPWSAGLKRSWLITLAILLHNLPEGFSVGVGGFESNERTQLMLATISLQNFPEGLIVALSLRAAGLSFWSTLGLVSLTAAVEVASSLLGSWAFHLVTNLLPFGLAFAAGAMLFVVCREMIPESQKHFESRASVGICLGICGVIVLKFLVPA